MSSGGICAYLAVVIPLDLSGTRKLPREQSLEAKGIAFAALLAAAAFLSQLANLTGLIWGRTFAGFLAGLLLLLMLSGFAFFRLVAFSPPADPPAP